MTQELQDKIQKAAFQMFRDWTMNAKLKLPELDFTIIDETILVNDLINSIKSGVNSLKKEERESKREMQGFDIGFICGFIYSNLNEHWIHEYIRKRSDEYKMLLTLKAIQLYLVFEDVALFKIDEIYKKMFSEDVNFENICFKPNKLQFKDFGYDLKINIINNKQNDISISLDNLITEKIVKLINKNDLRFLPETEKYFTEEDVKLLINEFNL